MSVGVGGSLYSLSVLVCFVLLLMTDFSEDGPLNIIIQSTTAMST